MPSKRESKPSPRFLLNSVDHLGRPIDPTVLSIAQESAQGVISYAEKLLGDPAVALNLFEEAAASVSEAVEKRKVSAKAPIRDLRRYLIRTFLNSLSQQRRKHFLLEKQGEWLKAQGRATYGLTNFEMSLLADEVMAPYDKVTQEIVLRHLESFSWKEIGKRYGLSAHAARMRYSRILQRAREIFKTRGIGG